MPVSPARKTAYDILLRVDADRGFAMELLQAPGVGELREVDRALATEIVMGVLRWRGELDFHIEKLSGKPLNYFDREISTILRIGVYQIRFLERVPKSAVVNEAVELAKRARKRSASGLVNAVLRKSEPAAGRSRLGSGLEVSAPAKFDDLDSETQASVVRALPSWLFARWAANFGAEAARMLALASVTVPPVFLRAAQGVRREEVARELTQEDITTSPGRYAAEALVVKSGNVRNSRVVAERRAVIQDEASQLVGELVAPEAGQRVLDLCAAPGIKTGQIAQALGQGSLVACDTSARRLRMIPKLLPALPTGVRLGLIRLDATRELPFGRRFDRILVDVPCSGTGTLARNPEIKWRLRPGDLARLGEMQSQILRNALTILTPAGRLVYATCALEPEENEQVVEKVLHEMPSFRLLSAEELSRDFPAMYRFIDPVGYFRTRPARHLMDGFFAAVVVRAGSV